MYIFPGLLEFEYSVCPHYLYSLCVCACVCMCVIVFVCFNE